MAANSEPGRLLLATLIVLTIISGLVDAVSYLGLGHVFTANMTGNVVLLGFAAAGASGFSAPACLTSLGAFLLGAAAAGRLARRLGSRRRLLVIALTTEAVATGTAAAVAFAVTGSRRAGPGSRSSPCSRSAWGCVTRPSGALPFPISRPPC